METPELVTVFRSADEDAAEQAETVCDTLVEAGLTAVTLDDSTPGVMEGCWEVRVPAAQAEQADAILDEAWENQPAEDPSADMNLVPLFEAGTEISELEAFSLKALLEANGIPVVVFGASMLPAIPYEVRVPMDNLEEAERIVAEAAAAGLAEQSQQVN